MLSANTEPKLDDQKTNLVMNYAQLLRSLMAQ